MNRSVWTNKKFSGKFHGYYESDSRGERIFVLKRFTGKPLAKVYESHEAAKAVGWKN